MIRDLFTEWHAADADLLSTDVRETEYDPVSVEAAAENAMDQLAIKAPDRDGFLIPLFANDRPVPTDEYVIYRPERGQIGWYDAGLGSNGSERFAECHRLEEKEIGHRLRFWLPEKQSEATVAVEESALPNARVHPTDRLGDAEQDALFEELKDFVRAERTAERDANWELYEEMGLTAAIRRDAVSGPFAHMSTTARTDGPPSFTCQFLEDADEEIDLRGDEGLFEGNRCIVDVEDVDAFPIEVEITAVDDPQVTFRPVGDSIDSLPAVESTLTGDGAEIWLHELLNPVPYDRRLAAIRQVATDPEKREVLTGNRPVEFAPSKYAQVDPGIDLNEYQRLALLWAEFAEDIVCIHGPPGTGKTRTLTAYVRHAVSQNQSVLVTAHSNQAVDNLLVGDSTVDSPEAGTLHAMAQDDDSTLTIARVGSNSKNRVVQSHYADGSVHQADVVASTTSGAAQFEPNTFDVAVVDEATQASRPATAIALNSAQKLVLAGDHKQLPPYYADETMEDEATNLSLFEYLLDRYGEDISLLLRTQYRMHEDIACFPNMTFYDGELETAERNRDWTIGDLPPLVGVDVQGQERRQDVGNSYYNPAEADAVAEQVELLAGNGVQSEDIGVISAYSGQIGQIRSRVNELNIPNPRAVSIDTVDSFQGSEREAIIVSFVRSNPDGYSGFLEFPEEGPRRLNVALTRARKRLVLVGNWETLGSVSPHRLAVDSCADHYARLAAHIRAEGCMRSH